MKGKSIEELRELFGVENDFTEDEKKQMEDEEKIANEITSATSS
jgi:hypothetical protein